MGGREPNVGDEFVYVEIIVLCNSIVYPYNANRPEKNDQVLKAYIYSCIYVL